MAIDGSSVMVREDVFIDVLRYIVHIHMYRGEFQ